MAFPGINLATVANLSFSVACNNGPGAAEQAHWAVQLNNSQWYVSTNYFIESGSNLPEFYVCLHQLGQRMESIDRQWS